MVLPVHLRSFHLFRRGVGGWDPGAQHDDGLMVAINLALFTPTDQTRTPRLQDPVGLGASAPQLHRNAPIQSRNHPPVTATGVMIPQTEVSRGCTVLGGGGSAECVD